MHFATTARMFPLPPLKIELDNGTDSGFIGCWYPL